MERFVAAREINDEVMREVAAGESFVVTHDGHAVARLEPLAHGPEKREKLRRAFAELSKLPPARLPGWKREDLYD